jgi:4-amino-4-deoxy-L-arabinose transferase-like glycosyltransferase
VTQRSPSASHLLVLLAAALLGFWSQLGAIPLFDLDEGAFSEATVEMVRSHDYLVPTLNGEPRYDKPILIYWLQAAAVKIFGIKEFAFRLPSAICATLWMLWVYFFCLRFAAERRAALLAAGSLALSLMVGLIGHAAIADALLDWLIAAAMLEIYRYFAAPSLARVLLVFLWMGLGFLAKGPIAVALPLAVSLVFFAWQKRTRDWLKAAFNPLGWIVFIAVVGTWVYPLWRRDHGEFLRHFLLEQNVGRYQHTLQGHGGHPWYYLVWLPLIVAPFTALLPAALRRTRGDALDGYLWLWFLTVFAFFSFSSTQLPHYLLYGCTALFILFGRSGQQAPARLWALWPALLLVALLGSLPWLLPWLLARLPQLAARPYESGILTLASGSFGLSYKAWSAAAAAAVLYLLLRPRIEADHALLGAAFALSALVWFGVVPVVASAQQAPVREAALRARELALPTVSYLTYLPSFSVYRGATTPSRLPQPGELVFVRLDRLAQLEQELGDKVTLVPEFKKGGVALLLYPSPSAAVPPPG